METIKLYIQKERIKGVEENTTGLNPRKIKSLCQACGGFANAVSKKYLPDKKGRMKIFCNIFPETGRANLNAYDPDIIAFDQQANISCNVAQKIAKR